MLPGHHARLTLDPNTPPRITFRPVAEDDLALLHAWLQRPHVAEWWGPAEPIETLREDWITAPGSTRAFIALLDGAPIGFVQCYVAMGSCDGWWTDETDPGVRGIDQFLADADRLGQGLGRAMVRAFVARLFDDPGVSAVQTDPSPANVRAIRCYRAAGFEAVGGVMTPDGAAWLMCARRGGPLRQVP